jgi:hypothetical protein
MKVMVIVKATKESEAGMMPDEKVIAKMGKLKEELVKAGIMLAGEGLHPGSKGKRLHISGGKKTKAARPVGCAATRKTTPSSSRRCANLGSRPTWTRTSRHPSLPPSGIRSILPSVSKTFTKACVEREW